MIEWRGLIPAVEFVVTRSAETTGYKALVSMGMEDKLFEMVVIRHPEVFSANDGSLEGAPPDLGLETPGVTVVRGRDAFECW